MKLFPHTIPVERTYRKWQTYFISKLNFQNVLVSLVTSNGEPFISGWGINWKRLMITSLSKISVPFRTLETKEEAKREKHSKTAWNLTHKMPPTFLFQEMNKENNVKKIFKCFYCKTIYVKQCCSGFFIFVLLMLVHKMKRLSSCYIVRTCKFLVKVIHLLSALAFHVHAHRVNHAGMACTCFTSTCAR